MHQIPKNHKLPIHKLIIIQETNKIKFKTIAIRDKKKI